MNKVNTFVIPIIRVDLIERCLETLYKHTPHNFYVYVIDGSKDGIDQRIIDKYIHLYIRPYRNLGFTKSTNTGVKLAQTKYVTMLNDDVEFINRKWWQGILDTFKMIEKATPTRPPLLVTAASIKLPDWSVGLPQGQHHHIIPYKEQYSEEDWNHLVTKDHYVNEHLTIRPGSVVDGINLYCSVIDRKKLDEVGLLDELFYPGGADDYDLCCRASMFGYRSIATTKAWVYHHWSKSFATIQDQEAAKGLIDNSLREGDLRTKWAEDFDLWGVRCKQCDEILNTKDGKTATCPKHPDEKYKMPHNTIAEL